MPDFGLYYVPPADHPLYRVGSDLLGYDVRTEEVLSAHNASRAHFPDLTSAWTEYSQQYGFHMTIGHAIQFEAEKLSALEAETEAILAMFDPDKPFALTPCVGADYVYIMRGGACLLRYDPNQAVMMLHVLVVARLAPLGTGTPQLTNYLTGGHAIPAHRAKRLTQYYYAPILDDFYPHFTLFNPLPTDDHDGVRRNVMAAVPPPSPMTIGSLCLLVRRDGETHYRIHREFPRPSHATLAPPSA